MKKFVFRKQKRDTKWLATKNQLSHLTDFSWCRHWTDHPLLWILFFYIAFQLITYQGHPNDVDSFFYLGFNWDNFNIFKYGFNGSLLPAMVSDSVIAAQIILFLCSCFSGALIYLICRKLSCNEWSASFATIFFLFDPLMFMRNKLYTFDKPIIVIMFFLILVYSFVENKNKWTIPNIIGSLLCLYLAWEGYLVVFLLFFGAFMLTTWQAKKYLTVTIMAVLAAIIVYASGYLALLPDFFVKKSLIAETRYAFEFLSGSYIFYIALLVIIWALKPWKDKSIYSIFIPMSDNTQFIYNIFIVSWFGFLVFFRMSIFAIPLLYIVWALAMRNFEIDKKFYIVFGLFIFCCCISFPAYYREPVVNIDNLKEALTYVAADCIVADWGIGHIIQYYAPDKEVLFKGHPKYDDIKNLVCYPEVYKKQGCAMLYASSDFELYKQYQFRLNYDCEFVFRKGSVVWND